MLNKKQRELFAVQEDDSHVRLTELKNIQELTTIQFEDSTSFVCDVNTGICGPAAQEKEEEK